jgi:excinuclease ABC subunit C
MGPCENLQSEEEYQKNIELIQDILQGKTGIVVNKLKEDLNIAVSHLNFEEAQRIKHNLELLSNYQSKSTVVSASVSNVDVFSIASEDGIAFVNFLKVMNGAIIQTQTIELKKRLDESDHDLLSLAIPEFRSRFNSTSKEIVVPFDMGMESEDFKFIVPQRGEKRKLLELSQKNVLFFKKERLNQYEKLNPEIRTTRVLTRMQEDLRMNQLPKHIECFDNSNIQGQYPVSAIVVFRDAKPSKKEYRHFNVKTVAGPDDFATMEEAVYRRYKRVLAEGGDLPQLIIIDGGKGQLSSALKSLKKLGIEKKMTVIAIAERLEELYYPNDPFPMHLDKRSETLKIIQHLRDEAHRFGITFHRKQRSKNTFKTELTEIAGIGKVTSEKLLKKFKSVKKIKEASDSELRVVLGPSQIESLRRHFKI